jgi:hypothetical protein
MWFNMTAFGAVLGLSSQALFLEVITEKADGTSAPPIKISSRCGKRLIRTSPSRDKRKPSTQSCSD